MKRRINTIVIIMLSIAVLTLSLGSGCNSNIIMVTSQEEGLDVIEQAWSIILNNYVDKDNLDTGDLSQAAIEGMLESLGDTHSSYLDPETYNLAVSDIEGKFEGIGAEVKKENEQITIVAPIPGSPAEAADIRPGDIILEIDGESTTDMSLGESVVLIRGPDGTSVSLLVLHENEDEPVEINIIRAEITLPSIYFEMMDDIAYIYIARFSERTGEEMSAVMDTITDESVSGIIIDLRNNLGGVLQAAVDVADFFIESGVIVTVVYTDGYEIPYNAESDGDVTDIPLIILVNGYSASASEVLAGALQDYGRGTVAGTVTYGKGSAGGLYKLSDGSGIYLTTAYWVTPNDHLIEGEGLQPDYELELEGEEIVQWAVEYLRKTPNYDE